MIANVLGVVYGKWLKEVYSDFMIEETAYWTDNEICLYWITTTKPLKPYQANRVGKIHDHSTTDQWHKVSTEENTSDLISRGCSFDQLLQSDLFWHGPKWLPFKDQWPIWNDTRVDQASLAISVDYLYSH